MDNRGSVPGRDRDFSLHHHIQTSAEAKSASYAMDTEDYSPEGERLEREADQLPPSGVKVKNT
jgi:hypothetical protein